ncbi:MAG TPA: IPT/TIG domain-containing protein [Novosphingobium sp.]|nr:IPT/TIG domain-containing protein [Novosphingobium sp.]
MAAPTLTEIIDAIGDLLPEDQKGQLVTTLLDGRIQQVRPGELITAGLCNQMLTDIADLAVRVSVLEGAGGGPFITAIQPKNVEITINSLLTVLGTGFDKVPEYNVVMLGGKQITQFNEASSQDALIFPVPDLFTGLPRTVDLTVEAAGKVSNKFPVRLKAQPRQQLGELVVTEALMPTGTLSADADVSFGWDVLASTTLEDSLALSLVVTDAAPAASAAQWIASAASGFSPPSPLAINPGQTRRVNLTVHAPAGAVSANLQLKVVGIDGQVQKSSPVIPWRAGQSLEPSSPSAIVLASEVGDDALMDLVDNMETASGSTYPQGFTFKAGAASSIAFEIRDQRGAGAPNATYACKAELVASGGDWTIGNLLGASTPSLPAGEDFSFVISIDNTAGAVGTEYLLRVEARQTATAPGLSPYTSFAILPIKLTA